MQAALVATHALYFGEPRYRLAIEALAFPIAGVGLWAAGRTVALALERPLAALVQRRRQLLAGSVAVLVAWGGGQAVHAVGEDLRERHGWATTLCRVDAETRFCLWRRDGEAAGLSPVRAAGTDVALAVPASAGRATARVRIGGGVVAPGRYRVQATVRALPAAGGGTAGVALAAPDGAEASATLGAGAPAQVLTLACTHAGGALELHLRLAHAPGAGMTAIVSTLVLSRVTEP
jgi:hypothetical protein